MKQIKMAVVGSRDIQDKNRVYFELDEVIKYLKAKGLEVVEIVSGLGEEEYAKQGADFFAREYAQDRKLKYTGFIAHWDDMSQPLQVKTNSLGKKYNALAGFKRNTEIVNAVTHVLALWKNNSPGTADTIAKARDRRRHLKIITNIR